MPIADDWPCYQPNHFTSITLAHHQNKLITVREVIAVASVMHKGKVTTGPNPHITNKIEYLFKTSMIFLHYFPH